MKFTHLLVEQKGKYFYESEHFQQTHDILDTINCFSSIGVEYRSIFPVKIKTRPCIVILRRKDDVLPPQHIEIPTVEFIDDSPAIEPNSTLSEVDELYENETDDDENFDELKGPIKGQHDGNEDHIVGIDLRKPSTETKSKLRKLIERHYRTKNAAALQTYNSEMAQAQRRSTKSNIKNIIKSEKMKELIEKILQMDLRTMCNLETETTKQCLLKIIDAHDID